MDYFLTSEMRWAQVHYDWGLRSLKSVLRVAGALKRADPGIDEEGILMRALRDFNSPKMPSADLPIFLRLIQVHQTSCMEVCSCLAPATHVNITTTTVTTAQTGPISEILYVGY